MTLAPEAGGTAPPPAPLTYPSPGSLRRPPFALADVAVLLGALGLLALVVWAGDEALQRFQPPEVLPRIDLDPRNLPHYAAASTLRMFVALACSLVFGIAYGSVAASGRTAASLLLPLLDVLQSVPVLGFLSITVSGFLALFPGSLLGLEAASVFAIFTSQAWNLAFSFHQSLRTIPPELEEAAALYRLPRWLRLIRLQIPAATIPLLWNAMMSFGGGWFFVAASEAISVLNRSYTLPGIGSYLAAAIAARNLGALAWAVLTIAAVIVLVDVLFWRPLIAWADRFRMEQSAAAEPPRSRVYDLLRTARIPHLLGSALAPAAEALNRTLGRVGGTQTDRGEQERGGGGRGAIVTATLLALIGVGGASALHGVLTTLGPLEVARAAGLGLLTLGRVVALVAVASLVWTPVGVAIGFSPRLSEALQPVVQFLACFPANFLFPFATLLFLRAHIPIGWGSILLMALGAQWYLLFNAIAGARGVPTDLREMATDLGLGGWRRWRRLILPAIFPAWVTGGITACGGAWNASIVAEVVAWGSTTLTAPGLGSYIAAATGAGDWPRIVLGIGMMSVYVVGLNRLLWRRLFRLAETRYHL